MGGAAEANHSIYVIYFPKSDKAYIGRSCEPRKRFKAHLTVKTCPVYQQAKKDGVENTFMYILKSGLSEEDAKDYEAKYLYENYFKLNLINKTLPSEWRLARFCETKEAESKFVMLMRQIDEDQKKQTPRVTVAQCRSPNTHHERSLTWWLKDYRKAIKEGRTW